jgi:uncharacterized cofD-like protein
MVCNLMTQPGETDNFTASDHLRIIESYLGAGVIQFVVGDAHEGRVRSNKYAEANSDFVEFDREQLIARGVAAVKTSLLEYQDGKIRHDANKLGSLIANLLRARAAGALMCDQPASVADEGLFGMAQAAIV